jgi:hypothetical protein
MRFLLIWLFFSVGFAQTFTGTYTLVDELNAFTYTLKLIENPDQSLTGNFMFDTSPTMITGNVISAGMAEATLQDETASSLDFSLQLNEPQITLKTMDTGDEIVLTRESSDTPQLVQIQISAQPLEEGSDPFGDDPKFNECMQVLEDENSDTQKIEECQSYLESVMGQTTIEEGIGSEDEFDAEELAYCQEFLADSAAVADDPDEASYCQSYIATYGNQTSTTPAIQDANNPLGATSTNPFSGTFQGNDIALMLQGDGSYTGTLEFQGKSYPVKASAEGNILNGIFNVNGTDFEFVATLQDMTLTLESGGQSYPMLKEPASN